MITVKRKVAVKLSTRSSHKAAPVNEAAKPKPRGKIPRVSRLMALAIKFDEMLRSGEVTDATELASLYNVTQPRMSQIRAMALLAPDIQEAILNFPAEIKGRSPITEKLLRQLCSEVDFARQREMWKALPLPEPAVPPETLDDNVDGHDASTIDAPLGR